MANHISDFQRKAIRNTVAYIVKRFEENNNVKVGSFIHIEYDGKEFPKSLAITVEYNMQTLVRLIDAETFVSFYDECEESINLTELGEYLNGLLYSMLTELKEGVIWT